MLLAFLSLSFTGCSGNDQPQSTTTQMMSKEKDLSWLPEGATSVKEGDECYRIYMEFGNTMVKKYTVKDDKGVISWTEFTVDQLNSDMESLAPTYMTEGRPRPIVLCRNLSSSGTGYYYVGMICGNGDHAVALIDPDDPHHPIGVWHIGMADPCKYN